MLLFINWQANLLQLESFFKKKTTVIRLLELNAITYRSSFSIEFLVFCLCFYIALHFCYFLNVTMSPANIQ